MKVLTVISSVLILQTSASFFDEFRGVVTTVEDSFGKLLDDVIYDVKETIDCTLLAVEQVLSLGMFGDQSAYDSRCKEATAPVELPLASVATDFALPPVEEMYTEKTIPFLTNIENRQVGSSILDVDQVLCDVLKKDNTHFQLESIKYALRNETERLTQISDLLRKQLAELSNEVKQKFKSIELQTSEPSVESIWNDIKILHEIEHRHQNTAEARKISNILDQILDILDANEEDRTDEDEYKIQEIMRKLSKQSKDGSAKLWKNPDDYPKDFREYANKIFEENSASSSSSSEKPETKTRAKENPERDEEKEKADNEKIYKPNKEDGDKKPKKDDDKENPTTTTTTVKPKQRKRKLTTITEKSLTIEELAAQYGSLFDVMPDIVNIDNTVESTKYIIKETEVNEMVMKSLDLESNKDAKDFFDDPDLLNTEQ